MAREWCQDQQTALFLESLRITFDTLAQPSCTTSSTKLKDLYHLHCCLLYKVRVWQKCRQTCIGGIYPTMHCCRQVFSPVSVQGKHNICHPLDPFTHKKKTNPNPHSSTPHHPQPTTHQTCSLLSYPQSIIQSTNHQTSFPNPSDSHAIAASFCAVSYRGDVLRFIRCAASGKIMDWRLRPMRGVGRPDYGGSDFERVLRLGEMIWMEWHWDPCGEWLMDDDEVI